MELNDSEKIFFQIFQSKLTPAEKNLLELKRLSSGAIEPYFNGCPLGKIKLTGRKHYMQICKNLQKVYIFEGNFQEMIEKQDETIKYLRKYCKF